MNTRSNFWCVSSKSIALQKRTIVNPTPFSAP